MEKSTMFKFAKASISIRAIKKPWQTVSHNQRVAGFITTMLISGASGDPHFFISSVVLGPLSKHSRTCQRVEIGRKGGTLGIPGTLAEI